MEKHQYRWFLLYQNLNKNPPVVILSDIVGKQVKHKAFGVGIITGISGAAIEVKFDKA